MLICVSCSVRPNVDVKVYPQVTALVLLGLLVAVP